MSNNAHHEHAHLTFVPANAVVGFLQSDPDHYYDTFTRFDLCARHVTSVTEYIDRIPNAIVDASTGLRARIREAVPIVDARLARIQHVGFNGKKAADLPWRIGFMKHKLYEDGLPHTRVDLIMLPTRLAKASDRELVDTLFHEKVHIYQKAYPRDLERWLVHNGFERVRRRTKGSRIRANPDIDGWVYKGPTPKGIREYKCLYNSETPRHIEDVKHIDFEHPFEMIETAFS